MMMAYGTFTQGNFASPFNSGGFTGAPSVAPQFRDHLFVEQKFRKDLTLMQRLPYMSILRNLGKKIAYDGGSALHGTKISRPAIGPYTQPLEVGGTPGFPNSAATNSTTITGNKYLSTSTAGVTSIGIPFPMITPNATRYTFRITENQGVAMCLDNLFMETLTDASLVDKLQTLMRDALNLDVEQGAFFNALYAGPITETASQYGSIGAEAVGLTNRANSAVPTGRNYANINGSSNLITPAAIADLVNGAPLAANMTGTSKNALFGNVPVLIGDANSPISYTTFRQLDLYFQGLSVAGHEDMAFVVDTFGLNQIKGIHEFINRTLQESPDNYLKAGPKNDFKVNGYTVSTSQAIRPAGSAGVMYGLAGVKNQAIEYGFRIDPKVIVDNRLNKAEQVLLLCGMQSYGFGVPRPEELAVVQYAPVMG
jgi:hypothetical protein